MISSTYIIVPVYNETAIARKVIEDILLQGYSVIVVDDGSDDNLLSVLKDLPVYYLRHEVNLGQGAAIQTGITFALMRGAEFFVTFDADGQHDAMYIEPMLGYLTEKRLDIVFGSRFMGITASKLPSIRKFILYFARLINYLFSGILLSDAHNGLRVFNRKAASSFNLVENKMAHATEILIKVRTERLKYGEYPVHILYTTYSKQKGQKISHGFKIMQDILLYKIFK